MVVVRLVVLVPVVARLDAIEVARLSWPELVVPPVGLVNGSKVRTGRCGDNRLEVKERGQSQGETRLRCNT